MIVTGRDNAHSTEVENVLYMHSAILEAAVVRVPDEEWGEAVKAVMVLKDGQKATEEKIITLCKENMAHYKALKSVDFMGELPKTGRVKSRVKSIKKGRRDQYWDNKGKGSLVRPIDHAVQKLMI